MGDNDEHSDVLSKTRVKVNFLKTATLIKKWVLSVEEGEDEAAILKDNEPSSVETVAGGNFSTNDTKSAEEPEVKVDSSLLDKLRWAVTSTVNVSGSYYYHWTLAVSVCCLYNTVMVIARATFTKLQSQYVPLWFCLDYLADLVFIVDTLVQARKGFLEDGIMVTNLRLRIREYFKSKTFWLDILSIFPTDIIYVFVGHNQPLLRMNRLFRCHRLNDFSDRTETRTNFPIAFRILKMFVVIFVVFHWNACIYFLLSLFFIYTSKNVSADNDTLLIDRWVFDYNKIVDPLIPRETVLYTNSVNVYSAEFDYSSTADVIYFSKLSKEYLLSLYWSSLTLTKLGEQLPPVSEGQMIFVIVDILLGLLILAAIVGSVSQMVISMNLKKTQFTEVLDGVKQYMIYRRVDTAIQKRVVKWFNYIWIQREGALEEEAAIVSLPSKLKAELAIQVHLETLKRVRIFQDCEPGLLIELVLQLHLQVFSPGDFICRKGDIGKEMYIVKRGSLNVVAEDGTTVFVTLKEGSVFGELSILDVAGNKNGNKRTASVRSVGYSDLFLLSKDQLWEALREYPQAKKLMLEKGREILEKDGLIDPDAAQQQQTYVGKSVGDKLEKISGSLKGVAKQVDDLYHQFTEDTLEMKKRITHVENVFHDNKAYIQRDCLIGRFPPTSN